MMFYKLLKNIKECLLESNENSLCEREWKMISCWFSYLYRFMVSIKYNY